ncbi:hypothetical protein BFX06_09020 [Sulfobacillus thermosulfidooxidans]|nr:hypothetical protein BFX05_09195 [Sulfobacillus thermosulfidooxidans]OLZ14395.1 hypothetical protein BFX06_09020 [Sulfobacillus thermosulfidooxidans]OLZ19138.1 hypothetical protein BFX07_05415 [Sulfobacillus thermosulfidooxidans]
MCLSGGQDDRMLCSMWISECSGKQSVKVMGLVLPFLIFVPIWGIYCDALTSSHEEGFRRKILIRSIEEDFQRRLQTGENKIRSERLNGI